MIYVTQETSLDLSKAHVYCEDMVFLTDKNVSQIRDPMLIRDKITAYMHTFTDRDYILCVGNPTVIGIVCAMAAEMNNGCFNLLQWDRIMRTYFVMRVEL